MNGLKEIQKDRFLPNYDTAKIEVSTNNFYIIKNDKDIDVEINISGDIFLDLELDLQFVKGHYAGCFHLSISKVLRVYGDIILKGEYEDSSLDFTETLSIDTDEQEDWLIKLDKKDEANVFKSLENISVLVTIDIDLKTIEISA